VAAPATPDPIPASPSPTVAGEGPSFQATNNVFFIETFLNRASGVFNIDPFFQMIIIID